MSRLVIQNVPVGECPVCQQDMEHLSDEYDGDIHEDSYTCDNCCLIVTYITQGSREYHDYDEIELQLERRLSCWGSDEGTDYDYTEGDIGQDGEI